MKPKYRPTPLLAGSIALVASFASLHAQSGSWNVDSAGTWSTDTNWNPVTAPGTTAGDVVSLTNNISGNRIVTIDTTPRTVGTLNIGDADDSNSFTLAASGGGFLTFNNSGGGASIVETGSKTDTISSNVTLADNLSASVAGVLTISGDIGQSGGARSITKTGTGSLKLSGNNSFSGGFRLSEGTLDTRDSTGAAIGTGTFTIDGGAIIYLTGGSDGVKWTTTNANIWTGGTINLNRNSGSVPLWQNDGDITLQGDVTIGTIANNISAGAILNGDINDGGNGYSLSIGGNQASVFTLAGNNTYSGGTTIGASRSNTVNINSSSALGTGAFRIASGGGNTYTQILDNTSGSAITLSTNNTQSWEKDFTFAGSNDLNLGTGAVTMNANRTVTVTAGTLTVGGAIGQSGGSRTLTKSGDGTLVLGGASTYTGATAVNAGTLIVTGNISTSSLTTVADTATLKGSGTVGALTVNLGGTLAPGTSIESLASGALTMASGSTFAYEVANNSATGADLLGVDGTLSITDVTLSFDLATLAALSGGGWADNDKLTLISYAGADITSGFTGYADNTTYLFGSNSWLFDYNDTQAGANYATDAVADGQTLFVTMTFTAVPEPRAALLGGLGLLMLLRRRRA